MLYLYENADPDLHNIQVEYTSLSKLVDKLREMKSSFYKAKDETEAAKEALRKFSPSITMKDRLNKTETMEEYMKLEAVYSAAYERRELLDTAIKGIRGAIQYYAALEIEDAVRVVMPSFEGKRAGPKTTAKFWHAVEERISLHVKLYPRGFHTLMVEGEYFNTEVYEGCDLTTAENYFNPDFNVYSYNDSFSGQYPTDWLLWARHVNAANDLLQSKFNDFLLMQDRLIGSLKIGEVEMLRVYAYDQKMRG